MFKMLQNRNRVGQDNCDTKSSRADFTGYRQSRFSPHPSLLLFTTSTNHFVFTKCLNKKSFSSHLTNKESKCICPMFMIANSIKLDSVTLHVLSLSPGQKND